VSQQVCVYRTKLNRKHNHTSIHRHQTPPGIATSFITVAECHLHLSASRPLRPNVTSSIKPEVHNLSQPHQRRTEPRPQGICTQNVARIGPVHRQTHRQTGWSEYSAPLPGRSNNNDKSSFIPQSRNLCQWNTWYTGVHCQDNLCSQSLDWCNNSYNTKPKNKNKNTYTDCCTLQGTGVWEFRYSSIQATVTEQRWCDDMSWHVLKSAF